MLMHLHRNDPSAHRMPDAANPEAADEKELVSRAAAGDVDAFERLYRGHVGHVFAVCLRMSGDRRQATELTQDVFVRFWERLTTFRGESALSSWLHRLAVNVVLNEMRTTRRRTSRVSLVEKRDDPDGPILQAATRPGEPESRIDLEEALATLPPGARTVFVLHDIEGYRHDEIAKLTGSAEGTSRAQLHRARKLLMEVLDR
jgi:RNA polymerase sigma-70 factor, ECF subfamily